MLKREKTGDKRRKNERHLGIKACKVRRIMKSSDYFGNGDEGGRGEGRAYEGRGGEEKSEKKRRKVVTILIMEMEMRKKRRRRRKRRCSSRRRVKE